MLGFIEHRCRGCRSTLRAYFHQRSLEIRSEHNHIIAAPACFGYTFQGSVALSAGAGRVGADGILRDLGPLRHLDRFFARHGACVVFAVAQQDDGAPNGAGLWLF